MRAATKIIFFDENNEKFFGDGPCALLQGIKENGSLHATAAQMGMAYSKAARLIKTAEKSLGFPLTVRTIGGKSGGGSILTREAEEWLEKYLDYRQACIASNEKLYRQYFGEKTSDVGIVIMASGMGRRFGGDKLMADFCGKPMIQWALDVTKDVGSERVVVTRNQKVKDLCEQQDINVIIHELPGRNDTIRLGLEFLKHKVKGCIFFPADQPLLSDDSVRRLLENIALDPQAIWRLACDGEKGAPVYFPKDLFDELASLPEGKGGSVVINAHREREKLVQVGDRRELKDIDTQEDYHRAAKEMLEK